MDPLFGDTFDVDGDGHVTPEEELFGYTMMHRQQEEQTKKINNQTIHNSYGCSDLSKEKSPTSSHKDEDDHLSDIMIILGPIVFIVCTYLMIKLWASIIFD